MAGNDDLLFLVSKELLKEAEEPAKKPAAGKRAKLLYFGVDEEAKAEISKLLENEFEMIYTSDLKQIPKLISQIQGIILDPSCSTFTVGINLTKKLKDDFKQIKVFHIIRQISNEYGVYMNNHPFQIPDYAAEMEEIPALAKFIRDNL